MLGPKDTRRLFRDMTDRKPATWGNITLYNYPDLSISRQEALMKLPIVEDKLGSPWDTFSERPDSTEFILFNRFNGYIYYVNTEGYDWPRYIFKITNFPHEF